jgi:hypothetical protein
MTLTACAAVFGLLVLLAVKANWARPAGVVVCVIFGVLLGSSPAGPSVHSILDQAGSSLWRALQGM